MHRSFLVLFIAAILVAIGPDSRAQEPAPLPDEVEERGTKILGCSMGTGLKKCVNKAHKKVKDDLKETKADLKKAEADLKKTKADLKKAEDDLKKTKADLEKAQAELQTAKAELGKVRGELNTAKQRADRLAANLKEADQSRKAIEAQAQQYQQTAEQRKQQLANAQSQANQARKQSARLQQELAAKARETAEQAPFVAELPAEKQALQAVRALELGPLFECLGRRSGGGPVDVAGYAQAMAADPAAFIESMWEDVLDDAEAEFAQVFASHLETLHTRPEEEPAAAAERGLELFERIASRHPAGRCLAEFTRPHHQRLAQAGLRIHASFQTRAERLFEQQVLPAVHKSVAGGLANVFQKISSSTGGAVQGRGLWDLLDYPMDMMLSGEQLEHIANAAFARHVAVQMDEGRKGIELLVNNIESTLASELDATRNLQDLEHALDPDRQFSEEVYLEIGLELMRAVAHNYIDSDLKGMGGSIILEGASTINLFEGTVDEVACAIAGLIPEVGAFFCDITGEAIDAVWSGLIKGMVAVGKIATKKAFDEFWDRGKLVARGELQAAELRDNAGPFLGLVDKIPTQEGARLLAQTQVADLREAVVAYHASVLSLAETAARD